MDDAPTPPNQPMFFTAWRVAAAWAGYHMFNPTLVEKLTLQLLQRQEQGVRRDPNHGWEVTLAGAVILTARLEASRQGARLYYPDGSEVRA